MITYCTNIHPGESWDDTFLNLRTHLLKIKAAVSPDAPFPVGLRLSNLASLEIDENASAQFCDWCQKNNFYVPTINGFPYGSFHSSQIKETVYIPDWRHNERVEYTERLAGLLDVWLPSGKTGSISTVPIGFKSHIADEDYNLIRRNLLNLSEHLDRLRQKSGKEIILSLEPEPGCVLETTIDAVRFFERMRFPEESRDCIGICFDCCHQAVEFEKAEESLSALSGADIRLGKIQVSSAPRIKYSDKIPPSPPSLKGGENGLDIFNDPCYLHQVVIKRKDGSLVHFNDIQEAMDNHQKSNEEEWRIHFHVPVFINKIDLYGTTRYFTEEVLSVIDRDILLEVETYTWQVLPPELQMETVTDSIIREIQWVQSHIDRK